MPTKIPPAPPGALVEPDDIRWAACHSKWAEKLAGEVARCWALLAPQRVHLAGCPGGDPCPCSAEVGVRFAKTPTADDELIDLRERAASKFDGSTEPYARMIAQDIRALPLRRAPESGGEVKP